VDAELAAWEAKINAMEAGGQQLIEREQEVEVRPVAENLLA